MKVDLLLPLSLIVRIYCIKTVTTTIATTNEMKQTKKKKNKKNVTERFNKIPSYFHTVSSTSKQNIISCIKEVEF